MVCKTVSEVSRHIKSRELLPAYIFYGAQSYFIDKYTMRIMDQIKSGNGEVYVFYGDKSDKLSIDEVSERVEALPMISARNCVVIKRFQPEGLSEFKKLEELLSNLPDTCVLVLSITEYDAKKSAKVKSLIKTAQGSACSMMFYPPNKSDIIKEMKQWGEISTENASILIERCGDDMYMLKNEVEKLCAYVDYGEITKEAIGLLSPKKIDAVSFDLIKCILKKDYKMSMQIIDDLYYLRTEPVAIIGALAMSFIDIYRANLALSSGRGIADIVKDFGYKSDYRPRQSMQDAGKLSLNFIVASVGILRDADYKLKSTKNNSRIVLERAVTEIFLAR